MSDFINQFIGGSIAQYPFLMTVVGTIMAATVVFMFYTIVGSLFRFK